jgi:hypothetical protein
MTQYFILKAGTERDFAEVQSPVDQSGNPYSYQQVITQGDRGKTTTVDERIKLADCIKCVTTLVVSERASEVIAEFKLPAKTVFLPIDVRNEAGVLIGPAIAIIFNEILDVVNIDESPHKKLANGGFWYFTGTPVVSQCAMQDDLDLLKAIYLPVLASERLKNAIVKAKLSNFTFQPVVIR